MGRSLIKRAALLTMALAGPALGQTGPELMLKPWDGPDTDEPRFELGGQVRHSWDGSVDETDEDFELTNYDAGGRFRLSTERGATAVGFEYKLLDLDTGDDALPTRLVDTSAAVGFGLGTWRDWSLAGTVGVGFAGDTPFTSDEAWYAKANLIAHRKLDDRRSVQLGLNFDGNRAIWPDVPLPIAAYNEKISDTFRYSVGFPLSSVQWQPADRLTLEASTVAFFSFNAEARYRLLERVRLFAGYESERTGFHHDEDLDNRRLFYQEQRLEAGVRLKPEQLPGSQLVIAGGYAFDREFERGFDVRDLDTVREVSDEPFVRIGLDLTF